MIQVQLTRLSVISMYHELKGVYSTLKDKMNTINVPVLDPYAKVEISASCRSILYEQFPAFCEHFESADAFYNAFRALNYFITTYDYFMDNRIDFNSFSFRSEDIIILRTFPLFKEA